MLWAGNFKQNLNTFVIYRTINNGNTMNCLDILFNYTVPLKRGNNQSGLVEPIKLSLKAHNTLVEY